MPRPPHYFKRWRVECTVGTRDGRRYFVRWVDRDGHGYRLHPDENRWVDERRHGWLCRLMPPFQSMFVALAAIWAAPCPRKRIR